MARKAISNKLRFEIFKRDEFMCQYCGSHPPKAVLHVDHITPVKLGGDNNISNLITSCSICNSGKSATSLNSIPKSLKDTAKAMKQKEAQIKGYNKVMQEHIARVESDAWRVANMLLHTFGEPLNSINSNHFRSIKIFIERLGLYGCLESVEIMAIKNIRSEQKAFIYFCGICWNKIKEHENGKS